MRGPAPQGIMPPRRRLELDALQFPGHDLGCVLLGDLFFHVGIVALVFQPAQDVSDVLLGQAEKALERADLVPLVGRRFILDRSDIDRYGGKTAGQDLAITVEDRPPPGLHRDLVPVLVEDGRFGPGVAEDLDLDEPEGDDGRPGGQDKTQDQGPLSDVALVECPHRRRLSGTCPVSRK